jgi:hypothetical protein
MRLHVEEERVLAERVLRSNDPAGLPDARVGLDAVAAALSVSPTSTPTRVNVDGSPALASGTFQIEPSRVRAAMSSREPVPPGAPPPVPSSL